jgi:CubicO group peptidase (beta-lactamase class C family)
MSKSFTSTAVGLAVTEKRLTVEDPVISFFPKEKPAEVSENLAALRVKHLLTMSVGNEKEPTHDVVETENWVKTFLAAPITHAPGSVFMYNSAATYMLSAIVQKLTGQRVVDYLRPRLFEPLGIDGPTWEMCPRGINTGGWGLSVPTEALAKFGTLYLKKGEWNGSRILPASWVEEATTFKIQQPAPANPSRPKELNDWQQGYCYQFWRCQHHAFRGDGAFGQYTLVLPEQDAVIAITGESKDLQGELDLVWEHLLPVMKEGPLTADPKAQDELTQKLGSLALKLAEGATDSPTAARVSGKTFVLEKNGMGIEKAAFSFQEGGANLTLGEAGREHTIRCGAGKWERGETALPGTPPRIIAGGAPKAGTVHPFVASGAWKDENTYEMLWRYNETPHHDRVTCQFEGDGVKIGFLSSVAELGGKKEDVNRTLTGKFG